MERRLVRKRGSVERRQKNGAGGAHFTLHLAIFGLIADEKIAPKRRDPRRCNGDRQCGNNEARRQAQLLDHTTVRAVTKNSGWLAFRVLESPCIGTFEGGKRMSNRTEDVQQILSAEDAEFRRWLEEHHACESRLSELASKSQVTVEDELEEKTLKKRKLLLKDQMAARIRSYETSNVA